MINQLITREDLQQKAPAVFSSAPRETVSGEYRFIPTSAVLSGLEEKGFYVSKAKQAGTRTPGKEAFARHEITLRHKDFDAPQLDEVVPQVILTNSHDGSAAYRLMAGLFRLVCSNGLVVASSTIEDIRVIHAGREKTINDIIAGASVLINNMANIINNVINWRGKILDYGLQVEMAKEALPLISDTAGSEIRPDRLLRARRYADGAYREAPRDLWKTFNVIQENVIRGGVMQQKENGFFVRTRAINSIDRGLKVNKGLWALAEKYFNLN